MDSNQLAELGIIQITKARRSELLEPIKQVIQEITSTDAQDLIIIEGEKVETKIKGTLTVSEHITPWQRDVFNYFVGTVGQENLKGRPSDYRDDYIDTKICELLLDRNNQSHDFNMGIGDEKSLRVHMYSVYSAKAPNKQALALSLIHI